MKYTEERPWGKFEQFSDNEVSTVKILHIYAGKRLSLQYHKHRDEFWKVIKGPVLITLDDKDITAKEGEEFLIKRGTKHRLTGLDEEGQVLEISFGEFDEEDNIRVEDDYGRCKSN